MNIDYDLFPRNKILCIDMKSFFASVEAVDRRDGPLKVCLAVVGDKTRFGAVVLAAFPALKKIRYQDWQPAIRNTESF